MSEERGRWGRGRRRRRQHVQGAMRDLAEAFAATATRVGHPLEITTTSARGLDAAVAALATGDLSPAKRNGVVRGAAAYLGEVVVRAGLGTWELAPGTDHPVLAMLPDRDPVLNLVTVVDRRIRPRRPESLSDFLDRCLQGFARPGPGPAGPAEGHDEPAGEPPGV